MVISELVSVFDPWNVVSILNLIVFAESTAEESIFSHGCELHPKSSTPVVATSSTKTSTMAFDFTSHVEMVEVGFENLKICTDPVVASIVAENV